MHSLEESKRNLGYATEEFKKMDVRDTTYNLTALPDEYYKFVAFFHMAVLCYVRPFKNQDFQLSTKVLNSSDKNLHNFLVQYRNYIVAHHENLEDKSFAKDPDNLNQSQFIISIESPSFISFCYNTIIPRTLNEIETYQKHVEEVQCNVQKIIRVFLDKNGAIFKEKLLQGGLFSLSNDKEKILHEKQDIRFNRNSEGSFTVVSKN